MGQCLSFQKIITTVHKQRTVYKHSMHNIAVIKTICPIPSSLSPHQLATPPRGPALTHFAVLTLW